MSNGKIIQFICLTVLWIFLCYLLIQGRGVTGMTIFTIIISGLIVYIPLYKKYIRNKKE